MYVIILTLLHIQDTLACFFRSIITLLHSPGKVHVFVYLCVCVCVCVCVRVRVRELPLLCVAYKILDLGVCSEERARLLSSVRQFDRK